MEWIIVKNRKGNSLALEKEYFGKLGLEEFAGHYGVWIGEWRIIGQVRQEKLSTQVRQNPYIPFL